MNEISGIPYKDPPGGTMKREMEVVCESFRRPDRDLEFAVAVNLGCFDRKTAERATVSWMRSRASDGLPYVTGVVREETCISVRSGTDTDFFEGMTKSRIVFSGMVNELHNRRFLGEGDLLVDTVKDIAMCLVDALGQDHVLIACGEALIVLGSADPPLQAPQTKAIEHLHV